LASQATYHTILDGVLYNDSAATPLTSDREVDVVLNDVSPIARRIM